eukprot:TRINITY_DN9738_c0_g1_i3.p1 TRINITY_DN9738_c0_g1~~TRINITY_DN9738_c0_g1_i3.p1  ORF type:complete len:101 (-),score=3.49 TRINITY_DN9738_c0_g1_i3:240-542(-)
MKESLTFSGSTGAANCCDPLKRINVEVRAISFHNTIGVQGCICRLCQEAQFSITHESLNGPTVSLPNVGQIGQMYWNVIMSEHDNQWDVLQEKIPSGHQT